MDKNANLNASLQQKLEKKIEDMICCLCALFMHVLYFHQEHRLVYDICHMTCRPKVLVGVLTCHNIEEFHI